MPKIVTENDWQSYRDSRLMRDFLRHGVFALLDSQPADRREEMRQHLLRLGGRRKVGLFACACCRRLWPLVQNERVEEAVEAATSGRATRTGSRLQGEQIERAIEATEQFLDGVVSDADLFEAAQGAVAATAGRKFPGPGTSGQIAALIGAHRAVIRAVLEVARLETEAAIEHCAGAADAAVWSGFAPSHVDAYAQQAALLRDIIGNPFRPVSLDPAWFTSTVLQLAKGMYESRDFSAMPILADALQDAACDNDDILNHCRDEKLAHVKGCWVVDLVLGKS